MGGAGPKPKCRIAQQGQRQGGNALRRGPHARVALGVAAQPVGVFQGVPGPANHRAHRQRGAGDVAARVGLRVLQQGVPFHMVDAGDAHQNQGQRRRQFQPRKAPIAPVVEQVGRDGDHQGQCADDHGGQRAACALDGAGQKQVIQHVANCRQLERGQPVGAGQAFDFSAVGKGQGQGDQAKSQVTAKGVQRGGVFGQQQRPHKHQAPHQACSQSEQHTGQHAATLSGG